VVLGEVVPWRRLFFSGAERVTVAVMRVDSGGELPPLVGNTNFAFFKTFVYDDTPFRCVF
jgi:hypothetical protein